MQDFDWTRGIPSPRRYAEEGSRLKFERGKEAEEEKKSTLNKRERSRVDMRPHFDIHYCLLIQRSDPELRILQYLGLIASPPVKGE